MPITKEYLLDAFSWTPQAWVGGVLVLTFAVGLAIFWILRPGE